MGLSIGDHIRQVIEAYPGCETHTAESLVWQAAMQVYGEHPWVFCIKEGRIVTEASYATGTLAATAQSTAITLTSGTWNPAWTLRRILISGRNESYDMATILAGSGTLSQAWQGADDAAATYVMYRDIYSLPSDCDLGRNYYILDPARDRAVRMKDYGVFTERHVRGTTGPYLPTWATHVGLDASAVPQIQLDPYSTDVEVYPLVYFASPTKPTQYSQKISPLFPASHEDIIWRKALYLYAELKKKWRERDELRAIYYDRFFDAVKQFDGGAQIERFIHGAYPSIPFYWESEIAASAVRGSYS